MISSTEPARVRLRASRGGHIVQLSETQGWTCSCAAFRRSGARRDCRHVRSLPAAGGVLSTGRTAPG